MILLTSKVRRAGPEIPSDIRAARLKRKAATLDVSGSQLKTQQKNVLGDSSETAVSYNAGSSSVGLAGPIRQSLESDSSSDEEIGPSLSTSLDVREVQQEGFLTTTDIYLLYLGQGRRRSGSAASCATCYYIYVTPV